MIEPNSHFQQIQDLWNQKQKNLDLTWNLRKQSWLKYFMDGSHAEIRKFQKISETLV